MTCDYCKKEVDEVSTGTCITAHVNLDDYGLSDKEACFDDSFYCPDCLNPNDFCKRCSQFTPKDIQKKISKKDQPF